MQKIGCTRSFVSKLTWHLCALSFQVSCGVGQEFFLPFMTLKIEYMRKVFKLLCVIIAAASLAACEKVSMLDSDSDTGGGSTESPTEVPSSGNDTLVTELTPSTGSVVTVSQFLNTTITSEVYVQGYIVGSCQRSIKNADFEAPFEGHTAVLLADHKDEKEEVIVIHLKTGTMRNAINLEDHPENCGKRLKIKGTQDTYLGTTGMGEKSVTTEYELMN